MKNLNEASFQSLAAWLQVHGPAVVMRVAEATLILIAGSFAIWILSRTLRRVVARIAEEKRMGACFLSSVVVKSSWACLAVVILAKLGVDVAPLIAGLGVTGFVLGFAFQESLGSLASGLMIALTHPFKVGDHVIIAGFDGTVLHLDMMAVALATEDNRCVTIPNKSAWGSPIVNFTTLAAARSQGETIGA